MLDTDRDRARDRGRDRGRDEHDTRPAASDSDVDMVGSPGGVKLWGDAITCHILSVSSQGLCSLEYHYSMGEKVVSVDCGVRRH